MCVGIPLKIINIDGMDAIGEINGVRKKIRIDLIRNPKVGDYVMTHAGFALDIISMEDAEEITELLNEVVILSSQ